MPNELIRHLEAAFLDQVGDQRPAEIVPLGCGRKPGCLDALMQDPAQGVGGHTIFRSMDVVVAVDLRKDCPGILAAYLQPGPQGRGAAAGDPGGDLATSLSLPDHEDRVALRDFRQAAQRQSRDFMDAHAGLDGHGKHGPVTHPGRGAILTGRK